MPTSGQKKEVMIMYILLLSLAALLQQSAGRLSAQDKIILDKHNAVRRDVKPTAKNMLEMQWSPGAAETARRWANKCIIGHSPGSERTVNGVGCGENLFMSTAPLSWDKVVQDWYDEKKDFNYGTGPKFPGAVIGHYTQVVWAKTFELGCAMAHCPRAFYKYFYVCHYCPAGNIIGHINTPYAAGPPCGDCPRACNNGLCTNPCRHNDKFSNCMDYASRENCRRVDWIKRDCAASCFCPTP